MNWCKASLKVLRVQILFCLIASLLFMFAGCSLESTPPQERSKDAIIAWIDEDPITSEQMDIGIRLLLTEKGIDLPRSDDELERLISEYLEDEARNKILDHEAEYRNITVLKEEFDASELLVNSLDIPEEFEKLEQERSEWMKRVSNRMLLMKSAAAIVKELSIDIQITDEQIELAYQNNIDKFKESMKITAQVIRVYDVEIAKKIHAQLKRKWNFTTLAERFSTMKGEGAKGAKYTVSVTEYPMEFVEDLKKLPLYTISDILISEGRYYIVKIYERIPEKVLPIETVRNTLEKELISCERSTRFQQWMDDRLAKLDIRMGTPISLQEFSYDSTNY